MLALAYDLKQTGLAGLFEFSIEVLSTQAQEGSRGCSRSSGRQIGGTTERKVNDAEYGAYRGRP